MQSRAEGNFSQEQTTWNEKIKKGQTGKEQKSKNWFIHSLVDLPVKPLVIYLLPQLRSSWFSFDQRSQIHHDCHHNGNAQFLLNMVEQNHQRVTPFAVCTQNLKDTAWSTMTVTLSTSSDRHLLYPTDSWIHRGRTSCFFYATRHWLQVQHCGVTWFSQFPHSHGQ